MFDKNRERTEDRRLFPRCKPCGKYCTCASARTDYRGSVHRLVCCQCALRPSTVWTYQLKRIMCVHAPPYEKIPEILAEIWAAPRDSETETLEAATGKLTLCDEEETWEDASETRNAVPSSSVSATKTTAAETPRIVIIDFQCFRDDRNDFIVKELAAVELFDGDNLDTHRPIKTIFWTTVQPPFDLEELNEGRFEQFRYVRDQYHGLSWEEGTMSADDAFNLLLAAIYGTEEKGRDKKKKEVVVYVKGLEKVKYITDRVLHDCRVEEYGGPSLKKMQSPKNMPLCPAHSRISRNFMCSLDNCYKIAAHRLSTRPQQMQ